MRPSIRFRYLDSQQIGTGTLVGDFGGGPAATGAGMHRQSPSWISNAARNNQLVHDYMAELFASGDQDARRP